MSFKRIRLKSTLPQVAKLPEQRRDGKPSQNDSEDVMRPVTYQNKVPQVRRRTQEEKRLAQEADRQKGIHGVHQISPASPQSRTAGRTRASRRRLQRRANPLDILQEPLEAGVRKVFDLRNLLIVFVLTMGVLVIPVPASFDPQIHRALALFVFTGSILALQPAPLPIAALMVPVAQVVLGIDVVDGAFEPFGTPVVFLILGSLFLAEALRKHGLTRRLALYVIYYTEGRLPALLFGIMGVTSLLSMWVLNTATAAVLIPVAIMIAQRIPRQEDASVVLKALVLGITYSASFGAIATIMASGENAIASGLLSTPENPFGFLAWMKFGLPIVIILLPISWFMLTRVFRLPDVKIDTQPVADEIQRLGTFSVSERKIISAMLVAVVLWITGSSIESALGLPQTALSSAIVAIGTVGILSIEEIIDWNDLKGVNWGVFFVIGAGLTLGDALGKTGADTWFANLLAPFLQGLPYGAILAVLVAMAFTLTQFMNNITLGAILAPILIELGTASNLDPSVLLIPTIFTLALAYTLPAASARMTLVSVTGTVNSNDMIRAGLAVGIPSAVVIWGIFYTINQLGWI